MQALNRQKSRFVTYIDLTFALVPFILLALHKLSVDLFFKPEWSLAASILFGQAAARMICGIGKHRTEYWHKAALYTVMLMIASFCSVYLYSIIEDPQQATIFHLILQSVLFILSIISFILFGAVGQHLLDAPEKDHKR